MAARRAQAPSAAVLRVRFEIQGWAFLLTISAHSNEDHGVRDVGALIIVAHGVPPTGHPYEGSFDHSPAEQDLEAFLIIELADDLVDEIEVRGLVNQF